MPDEKDIDSLIKSLAEYRKGVKVEEVLEATLSEPVTTQERLRQIEQVLETIKELGLFGGSEPQDLHILVTLGRVYERLSHLQKAKETYEVALELAARLNDGDRLGLLHARLWLVLARTN